MIPILDILNIGGKIIDKIFPDANAAEAAKLKLLELQQSGELAKMQAEMAENQEITKRWTADMASDSWLSKNIRPLTLLLILGGYFVFALMSAFDIDTHKAYVELLGQWGLVVMTAYFGSRGAEKIAEMKYKAKEIENGSK
jgi:hypothetical protein